MDQEADAIASGEVDGLALDPRGDEGLARRLKALACTAPLHDLDARKSQLQWADATAYQMAEIGFQAIDQVTIAIDFDHGASHDQVVARLLHWSRPTHPAASGANMKTGRAVGH